MPKRSPRNQVVEGQAAGERSQTVTRETKSKTVLDEEANRRALDEAAGVARRPTLSPDFTAEGIAARLREQGVPVVTRPPGALPLLKADTKEKRLYEIARACTANLTDTFFDEFPDRQEVLELALDISARLLAVAILNPEMPPTQRIASMRLAAALAGKQIGPTEEEQPAKQTHTPAVDASSAMRSIDKIRQLTKMEQ
jgi:hypothetical protein